MERARRAVWGRSLIGLGLMLSAGAIAAVATADPATESVVGAQPVVPYDGFLTIGGAPVTGLQKLRFELYDASTGGNLEWSEEQDVEVYDGRFSVGLGSVTNLTDTILDAERVWLSVVVIETDSNGAVLGEEALAGRQAIAPAPFAAWAVNSSDFVVAGDMNVASGTTVSGTFDAETTMTVSGTTTVTGDVDVTGTSSSKNVTASTQFEATGALSVVGNTTATNLDVRGDTTLGDDASADDVDFEGALDMNGDIVMASSSEIRKIEILAGNGTLRLAGASGTTYSEHGAFIDANGDVSLKGNFTANHDAITAGTADIDSDVEVDTTLTVGGDVSSLTGLSHALGTCPTTDLVGYTDSQNSRLCVYKRDQGNKPWHQYANGCHSNYGAMLCDANEIRIAIDNGIITSSNIEEFWIANRGDNNDGFYINRDGSESDWRYNFDGVRSGSSDEQGGAYCCRTFHNAGY